MKLERKSTSKFGKNIIITVAVVLTLVGVTFLLLVRSYIHSALKPVDPNDRQRTEVYMPIGASNRRIGSILQKHHLIWNNMAFMYYLRRRHVTALKAGYYEFSPDMTLHHIARRLQKGGTDYPHAVRHQLRVPNGLNAVGIAKLYPTKTRQQKFLQVYHDPNFQQRLAKRFPRLQLKRLLKRVGTKGMNRYLSPGRYANNVAPEYVIAEMFARADAQTKRAQALKRHHHLNNTQLWGLLGALSQTHLRIADQQQLFKLWSADHHALNDVQIIIKNRQGKVLRRTSFNYKESKVQTNASLKLLKRLCRDHQNDHFHDQVITDNYRTGQIYKLPTD